MHSRMGAKRTGNACPLYRVHRFTPSVPLFEEAVGVVPVTLCIEKVWRVHTAEGHWTDKAKRVFAGALEPPIFH